MSTIQKVGKQRVFDAEKVQAKAPASRDFEVSQSPSMMPPPMQLTASPASAGPMQSMEESEEKKPAVSTAGPIQLSEEEEDEGWGGMDWLHLGLDVAGLIPVVGEAFDLINAGIYAIEGDYLNAGLSAASAVPFAGYGATAVKMGIKGADQVKNTKKAIEATQTVSKGVQKATSKSAAKAGEEAGEQALGGVYRLVDSKGVVKRTGRTKNHAQRAKQHATAKDTKGLKYEDVYRTDDYATQRGLEHLLYKAHSKTASKANGGLNKIKAIADKNKKKDSYLDAAQNFLNQLIN